MKKLKQLLYLLRHQKLSRMLLSHAWQGYFVEIGWIESYRKKYPLDAQGNPIPWTSYSFIKFIESRLANHSLFEFGSGGGTLYYAKHCSKVVAVEHEKDWYEKIKTTLPVNTELIYQNLVRGGDYCKMAASQNMLFDIIIVDGRDRVNCILQSVAALSEQGVMVLDDSERSDYKEGIDFLAKQGFKCIDLWGISPGCFYNKSTSVYYRNTNCLGI